MPVMPNLPHHALLDDAGLNRQHVFNLADLPADLLAPLDLRPGETQLLLFGHAGRRLWDCVQAQQADGRLGAEHPIDEHSQRTVERWLREALPGTRARFVYPVGLPPGQHVGLQRLGSLAGWHHASPFMVGIDARWGSWFAYRAAVVTDSGLPPSPAVDLGHPCPTCTHRRCIEACPGRALDSGRMEIEACQRQRLTEGSPCASGCVARLACPVGAEHRYDISQLRHSGRGSLEAIRRHRENPGRA